MPKFAVGQPVFYRGAWGTEAPRACLITGIGEKNGRVVYDNDLPHWGYEDQYAPDPQAPLDVRTIGTAPPAIEATPLDRLVYESSVLRAALRGLFEYVNTNSDRIVNATGELPTHNALLDDAKAALGEIANRYTVLLLRPDWQRSGEAAVADWVYRAHVEADSVANAIKAALGDMADHDGEEDPDYYTTDNVAPLAVYQGALVDLYDPQASGDLLKEHS